MSRTHWALLSSVTGFLACWAGAVFAGAESLQEPEVPQISEANRQFLSRLARRTLRDAAMGAEPYEPSYVPEELQTLSGEVVVRLRQGGFLSAETYAGPGMLAVVVRDAALACYRSRPPGQTLGTNEVNDLLIEIEVVGPPQALTVSGDWTQHRVIDPFIEPGVHGMIVRGSRGQKRFCPSEVFTSDIILADALKAIAQHLHSDPSQVGSAELFRFRTAHWVEPSSGSAVVSLQRGLTVVSPSAVSAAGLAASIDRLAEYMAYRQQKTGLFAYAYEPSVDRYSDDDNVVRQAGAALAMAFDARYSEKSASRAAADAAIRRHLEGLTDVPDVQGAAFIATADKKNKLGVTALVCMAMSVHPQAERYAATREKLIQGMLWLQRPSGMFITTFPPTLEFDAQEYFPGEALLAMATEYDLRPSAPILEAFDRAIAFYQSYFREEPSPAFVPWQVQAFVLMARHTQRRDYVDFVFELTDWLAAMQIQPFSGPWPEMWGGVASYQAGRAGVATAAYLEGFADALALARSVGDVERAAKYEAVVRSAARFVMQLQIRPEEAYFIRSPQDAVGGIRTSPSLNLLRIDHCQHALIGLIKARQVLYGDRG